MEIFLNDAHKRKYRILTGKDQTSRSDRERQALFFVISGNAELYLQAGRIYDFYEHRLGRDCPEELGYMCSSSKLLLYLGLNLYNGWYDEDLDPVSLFRSLDENNRRLALNAMTVRFM